VVQWAKCAPNQTAGLDCIPAAAFECSPGRAPHRLVLISVFAQIPVRAGMGFLPGVALSPVVRVAQSVAGITAAPDRMTVGARLCERFYELAVKLEDVALGIARSAALSSRVRRFRHPAVWAFVGHPWPLSLNSVLRSTWCRVRLERRPDSRVPCPEPCWYPLAVLLTMSQNASSVRYGRRESDSLSFNALRPTGSRWVEAADS
jgi:hypothetical protein